MIEHVWGIDTIDANVSKIPLGTPVIWAYVTGTTLRPEIEWEPSDIALFPHSQVYRIDQGFGDQGDLRRVFACDEFDLEAEAWTPPVLAHAIQLRNQSRWSTRVYASDGPWNTLLAELARAGISARSVFWREANWNLSETEAAVRLGGARYAVQWASPSSNPLTGIPGSSENLTTSGADLNVIRLGNTKWQG